MTCTWSSVILYVLQSIRVKLVQNASPIERRYSSWIGGSILTSLVSPKLVYMHVCAHSYVLLPNNAWIIELKPPLCWRCLKRCSFVGVISFKRSTTACVELVIFSHSSFSFLPSHHLSPSFSSLPPFICLPLRVLSSRCGYRSRNTMTWERLLWKRSVLNSVNNFYVSITPWLCHTALG